MKPRTAARSPTAARMAARLLGLVVVLLAAYCPAPAAQDRVSPLFVEVTAAAFSPDNKYVLVGYSGGKKLLTLWETATGKEFHNFPGHTDMVVGVAFVSGGRRVLSISRNGKLLLHEVASGKLLRSRRAHEHGSQLTASSDGQLALTCGFDREESVAKLWSADYLKLLRTFGGPNLQVVGLALSPDHKWALTGIPGQAIVPGLVQLWDLRSGRAKYTLSSKEGWECPAAAFSPDSRLALISKSAYSSTGLASTSLALWDVTTSKVVRLLDGGEPAAQFLPDGKQVVGVAARGPEQIRLGFWDVASGKRVRSVAFRKQKEDYIRPFFSPDGRLALADSGGVYEGPHGNKVLPPTALRLVIWDLTTGRVVRQWERPPAGD